MADKRSVFLIAALGASVTVNGALLTQEDARAGYVETRQVKAEAVYTRAQISNATGQQMATAGCNLIDAEYGLTGEDVCTLADMRMMCQHFGVNGDPNAALIRYYVDKTFTLVPGEPE